MVTLDASNPKATANIALSAVPSPFDQYEPDDTIELASKRPSPLGVDGTEMHSLPSQSDIDVVPVTVAAGYVYRIRVGPIGVHPADRALVGTDAQGAVRAHANDNPGDYVPAPTVTFTASRDGLVFARVTRADAVLDPANSSITLTRLQSNR